MRKKTKPAILEGHDEVFLFWPIKGTYGQRWAGKKFDYLVQAQGANKLQRIPGTFLLCNGIKYGVTDADFKQAKEDSQ